jgi:putative hemolysin
MGMEIGWEIAFILLLILGNGIFAMSEIAIVSARKTRLQQRAQRGDAGSRRALELASHPNRFLATVQIGITLVGIFAGALGGATIASGLSEQLAGISLLAPWSRQLGLLIVVLGIGFVSLVVGELVPKRIALTHPERIASRVAGPMIAISILATPFVRVLSFTTDAALRLLRVQKSGEPPVTEEEIADLMEQGARAGIFEEREKDMVTRVFQLADQTVRNVMTPRRRIVWLDVEDPPGRNIEKMKGHRHTRFPVCEGGLDKVLGIVDLKDLFARRVSGEPLDLRAAVMQPLLVPEDLRTLRLLDLFRSSGIHFAFVVDEHGDIQGVVTLNDIMEQITGDLDGPVEERMIRREDGSWLIDGSTTMDEVWDALGITEREEEAHREYNTLAGYVISRFGRIPATGATFEAMGARFEVVDMDGWRVDKVLVSRVRPVTDTVQA